MRRKVLIGYDSENIINFFDIYNPSCNESLDQAKNYLNELCDFPLEISL